MTINLNCGIYQIRNIITNYCYSGQSIELKERELDHWSTLKNNKHKNSHLQNSYNKHGKEFFIFEILICCPPEELTKYEQLFCDIDKTHGLSYNIRDCVDSNKGIKWTEETKEKMSIAQSGENHPMFGIKGKDNPNFGTHRTEETCKKIGDAKRGEKNYNFGKHLSDETKNKISENAPDRSGKNNPFYGKTHSDDVKNKISNMQKGKKNHNFGKHFSDETRNKMSESGKNKIFTDEHKNNISLSSMIKKEVVLKILKLLENNMSVLEILKNVEIDRKTVYKVKNGFYDDIYNLPKNDKQK